MTDMKKALAFIKENASDAPKRTTQVSKLPEELVEEILNQIDEHDGEFAVNASNFNEAIGWSREGLKNYYLKNKLNRDYQDKLEDGKEWHVGSRNKGEFYIFTIQDIPTKKED